MNHDSYACRFRLAGTDVEKDVRVYKRKIRAVGEVRNL